MIDQNLHTNAAWLKLSGLSLLIALSTICLGLSKTEGPSSVTPQCNNITHPGSIGYSATLCGGTVDPGTLVSVENASGGSGTLEYMWLKSTSGCPNDFSQIIPGANSTTYTPGSLSQTTWFRRCARRTNCSDWYETDCIKITVDPNCSLPPEGWSYTCEDGIEVEVVGEGIRCANSRTISIPNPGNVTQIVAEVVYKGSSPNPTQYTFTTNNQSIVAPVIMTSPARGYVFRALLNPANFVSINIPSQNRCNAQSMVLYIFRNTGNNAANSGKFVEAWLFQSSRCETLPIPVGPAPRDILITAPLSELTSDGRIARVTAVSGSASQTITVNDYNLGDALNITPFILPNVPASATSVNICVESPSGTVPSGQSLVFASALSVKPACKTCDDSDLSANINIISNYNGQAISCLGAADARIQVQSTGGLSPYTYAWSTGDNSATLTNLAAGTYRLTITDAFACTIERSITINDPDALQLDLNISSNYNGQDISCFGAADGEITATVNGGTPPYSYNWLNGQSTATVTGLTAGNYVLLVSDANGCTISDNISLQNPPQLTATIQIESDFNGQAISCPGESDAALRVLVNGGTAPYTYKWSDNSTNIRIDNLAPGNYAVTVKDANNCQTQANINITAPPTLDLGIDVLTDYNGAPVSCSDGADGSVRANPNGGTPPYTYNWSDGQNGQVATGLTVGNYGLTVADANGCTATSTTSLTAPEPLNCSASINTNYNEGVAISTFGGSDGAASASATGGVGPYVYQWNDAAFQTSREATNLSAGTYTVQVSDINGCTCTANISLSNPAKLGDQVFEDLNANGIQEAGEPSVANVAIQLSGTSNTGAPVNRAGSSDANGQYSFDGLPAGDYTISITTPQDFLITYQDEGADDAKDSDIDPNTSNSTPVALALGEYNQDLDIGLYQWAAIGDQVWIDENANGLQDNGEIGLADVEIQLEGTTGNGTPISLSLNSQSDGTYLFENLIPGNYQLIFSQPTTFQRAYLNEGGNEALDSDADPISGRTATEQLTSRERNLDYDAGYYKWASLGDRVWEDVNGNGLQDGGEPGLANVTVRLEGQTGNGTSVNRSILTANNGQYLFDELIPGAYQLIFESPNGFSTTYDKQGLDDTQDSDANPNTGQTATELLISGEDNTDYDAGYYQPVSIGDLVWEDVDGNGIQDSGEPGIANASVRLDGFTGNGTPISQSLNTGANGEYRFDDLFPGTYKLTFVSPNGFSPTYLNLGADDELDSDADPINGMTPATTLVSGDQEDRFDAGYYRAAAIGNLVWDDLNGNGIQDSGEPGLANVLITLIGTDGAGTNVTQSQSTLANGTYLFENLRPGEYKLTFSTQTGFLFTYNEEGNNEALDSDADPINGMSPFEILESGEINRDYDAGQYAPARIGDQTWLDCDKDGIFDSGEVPLAFVPISLEGTTGNGTPISLNTSSDNSGQYQFVNLRPGTYQLTFGFPNLPNGLAYAGQDQGGDDSIDSDVGIDGKTAFINLQSKAQNDKVDVGYMDVQAPLIDPIAADLIVECDGNGNTSALNDWLNSQGGAQAVDNISPVSGITWSHDYTTLSDDCGATGQAIVTFTATDECGNAAAVTAQFIIQDTRAPAFSNVPADLTVNCDEVPNAANVQIADICDANANLTYQEIREAGACEDSYLLRR
ncbi:MAG: SdrD B-like domain-containing protein, partial [Bacteroidota bacterium]